MNGIMLSILVCCQYWPVHHISFRRFNYNRELIPNCWRSYRESTFANIKLCFRNINGFEMDDLWVIGILGKCNRLTKYK